MRNTIILILFCVFLNSCAEFSTDRNAGTTKTRFFASRAEGYYITPEGAGFVMFNGVQVPMSLIRTVGSVAGAYMAMQGMLGLSDNLVKTTVSEHGVTKALDANKTSTNNLRITEGTTRLGITEETKRILAKP